MSQAPPPRTRLLLADTPDAVGLARLHITNVLARWGVPPDSVETVKLLVSELATNAVRHPNRREQQRSSEADQHAAGTFEIMLDSDNDTIRLSVWDRDARPPVLQEVGVEASGGRGVFLVAAMSRRWGCYPANGRPGKVVWAEVSVCPEERRAESDWAEV
ncbi:ATP-binding protein [Streptomyces sp. RFCAC02]|uniref:ATP-binding protein n=1 Tax=Streptomyces sp. RFCAC02 TaxID=2499143 RepID=UPI001F0EE592|nr:ATP-binding protein [Streptomyces sp. RFCAC02]